MLSRMPGVLLLFTVLSASSAGLLCHAQQAQTVMPVRYHFGDDPSGGLRWSEPGFDSSAWPVAENGRWPVPPAGSDGLEWTRIRVPVSSTANGPLAVRISNNLSTAATYQLFVNGQPVAHLGSFPPKNDPLPSPAGSVFDLPPGLVLPGTTAVVAFREWFLPRACRPDRFLSVHFEIGESSNLRLANHADRLKAMLSMGPDLGINVVIAVLGFALLVIWRWVGGRELLLCSGLLLLYSIPALYGGLESLGLLAIPWRLNSTVNFVLQALQMAITVELIWTIHGLRAVGLKRLSQASLVVLNGGALYAGLKTVPFAGFSWILVAMFVSVQTFNLIIIGTNLWAFFVRGQNRLIAVALALIAMASLLGNFGIISKQRMIGPFHFTPFYLAFFASALALFVMLGQHAWQAWRARDELRVEFEAAHEVQQQLIAPAVNVPGFKIESVYAPAKQVGGDFFCVIPESEGGVLVVVGDVSGKGLKAAMTVSAIMGALRGCDSRGPAKVLEYLNRVLYGQVSGFVTCCATLVARDGEMTHANAGNPAPYRNGDEMAVEAGLPLGLLTENSYVETHYQIAPGDRVTFVSDGVLEARNAKGELYGFERTQVISVESAEVVAQAAQAFGQEDDITVLSVTRVANLNPALA